MLTPMNKTHSVDLRFGRTDRKNDPVPLLLVRYNLVAKSRSAVTVTWSVTAPSRASVLRHRPHSTLAADLNRIVASDAVDRLFNDPCLLHDRRSQQTNGGEVLEIRMPSHSLD